jgi:hypothetical protein
MASPAAEVRLELKITAVPELFWLSKLNEIMKSNITSIRINWFILTHRPLKIWFMEAVELSNPESKTA